MVYECGYGDGHSLDTHCPVGFLLLVLTSTAGRELANLKATYLDYTHVQAEKSMLMIKTVSKSLNNRMRRTFNLLGSPEGFLVHNSYTASHFLILSFLSL